MDYQVQLTNSGPSAADSPYLTVSFPPGFVIQSWDTPTASCVASSTGDPVVSTLTCEAINAAPNYQTLLPGVSMGGVVTVSVPDNAQGSYSPTVSAGSDTSDPADVTIGDSGVTIHPASDLTVTLTSPSVVEAGQPASYQATVTNNGPSTASDTQVTFTVPSGTVVSATGPDGTPCTIGTGTVTCQVGSLPNGSSTTVALVVRPDLGAAGGTACVTATTGSDSVDTSSGNNQAEQCQTVQPAPPSDVTVTLTPDQTDVPAGENAGYTLDISNDGRGDATNVVVMVNIPDGLSDVTGGMISAPNGSTGTCHVVGQQLVCVIDHLPGGDSASFHVEGVVDAPPGSTVTVPATNVTTDQSDDATIQVAPPIVGITQSSSPASGSVSAGEPVSYTLSFTNNSTQVVPIDYTSDLTGILDDATVSALQGMGLTVHLDSTTGQLRITGSLTPGQTGTVTFTATPNPDGERGDSILTSMVYRTGQSQPVVATPGCHCATSPNITIGSENNGTDNPGGNGTDGTGTGGTGGSGTDGTGGNGTGGTSNNGDGTGGDGTDPTNPACTMPGTTVAMTSLDTIAVTPADAVVVPADAPITAAYPTAPEPVDPGCTLVVVTMPACSVPGDMPVITETISPQMPAAQTGTESVTPVIVTQPAHESAPPSCAAGTDPTDPVTTDPACAAPTCDTGTTDCPPSTCLPDSTTGTTSTGDCAAVIAAACGTADGSMDPACVASASTGCGTDDQACQSACATDPACALAMVTTLCGTDNGTVDQGCVSAVQSACAAGEMSGPDCTAVATITSPITTMTSATGVATTGAAAGTVGQVTPVTLPGTTTTDTTDTGPAGPGCVVTQTIAPACTATQSVIVPADQAVVVPLAVDAVLPECTPTGDGIDGQNGTGGAGGQNGAGGNGTGGNGTNGNATGNTDGSDAPGLNPALPTTAPTGFSTGPVGVPTSRGSSPLGSSANLGTRGGYVSSGGMVVHNGWWTWTIILALVGTAVCLMPTRRTTGRRR